MARERQTGEGVRQGGEGRRNREKDATGFVLLTRLISPFRHIYTLYRTTAHIPLLKLLLRHALTTTPSPKLEISPRTSW